MDGTESGMAIGLMPLTAAKPTGMGGMWMGGSTVIDPAADVGAHRGEQREGSPRRSRPGPVMPRHRMPVEVAGDEGAGADMPALGHPGWRCRR